MLVIDSDLKEITVKMYGRVYVLHPAEDLELHPSSIGDHLQEQASRFAFYATVRDMAKTKVENAESVVAEVEGGLSADFRSGVLPLPKTTDDAVKLAVRGHQAYIEAKDLVTSAKEEFNKLNSVVEAFEHRREMLIEMSHRANNTTWNDRDIKITVSATITPVEKLKAATAGMGKHPTRK